MHQDSYDAPNYMHHFFGGVCEVLLSGMQLLENYACHQCYLQPYCMPEHILKT
jgi:hypothetical protein